MPSTFNGDYNLFRIDPSYSSGQSKNKMHSICLLAKVNGISYLLVFIFQISDGTYFKTIRDMSKGSRRHRDLPFFFSLLNKSNENFSSPAERSRGTSSGLVRPWLGECKLHYLHARRSPTPVEGPIPCCI